MKRFSPNTAVVLTHMAVEAVVQGVVGLKKCRHTGGVGEAAPGE